MEENISKRPANPRRKKKTQMQIFKESYLPVIIAGIALLFICVFIIGSIVRAVQRGRYEDKMEQQALEASVALVEQQTQEAQALLTQVKEMTAQYDYVGAMEAFDGFSGSISDFPELNELYQQCKAARETMVKWVDTNNIPALSFQMLIADPQRAFQDEKYGKSYNKNFITTEEFTKILHGLYENNYILVKLSDIYADGQLKELYLPADKKPIILVETQVNYNTYMIDSNGDKLPDQGGDGFASKLVIDANGNIVCEMVDSSGTTQTGAYDLVPILDSFVATHPDFSFKGAKAVLALTGYDGLFGYRTNPSAAGAFDIESEAASAKQIAEHLRESGYELACYTYENVAYGQLENAKILYDMNKWQSEVEPILGTVDTLVFARNSDISDSTAPYSGEKFETLQSFGFTKYLGFCTEATCWFTEGNGNMRLGRILITGSELKSHPDWYEDFFDASTVLDTSRP